MAARVFAVLAAVFLVSAVALASLTPFGLTLGQGLVQWDEAAPAWLQRHSLAWAWDWVELPFLLRPLWLIPATLGLVCAGLAASFNFGRASPSRRRRS